MRARISEAPAAIVKKPELRALIVGINDYPGPANRLEGCVNDAFRISGSLAGAWLQSGEHTCCLEQSAPRLMQFANAWRGCSIGRRAGWSVYFSTADTAPKCRDETDSRRLITWTNGRAHDFAWTEQTAITDKDLYRLYSDLPYTQSPVSRC